MVTGIILAAGNATRMGENKLLMDMGGKNALYLCYEAMYNSDIDNIIIAVSEEVRKYAKTLASESVKIVSGGSTRAESVYNALCACDDDTDIVVIHDGARCLVTPQIFNVGISYAQRFGSGIAAIPCVDTLRKISDNSVVDRDALLVMQTPQCFRYKLIKSAYEEYRKKGGIEYTDDCSCYVAFGHEPKYFIVDTPNMKLTYPEDKEIFKAILKYRGEL